MATTLVEQLRRHQHWLIPVTLLTLSIAVRFIYINQIQDSPIVQNPIMDERYHVELAEKINSPAGLGDEPFFRAPLYPHVFAFIYRLTGDSQYRTRLIQGVLGSFLPLLVLLIGIRFFNRGIALIAAFITAVYPMFIYYDASLLITSLMTLLTALLVWQLYRCQERPTWGNFILAGVLLGLAGITRPNILLLGPVLIIWILVLVRRKLGTKQAFLRYVVMGAASLLMILPITLRNYAVSGDLVFIAWQGGYNFFIGNNREANGWSATVPGIDITWQGGYQQSIRLAQAASGRELEKSEVSDFWYDMAWKEISSHPAHFVKLFIKKFRLFINGYEIPNNQNIYMVRMFSPLIRRLLVPGSLIYFPYGIIAPLALIGLGLSVRHWRRYLLLYLVLGSYVFTLLLFFVCARFRQPVLPIMILFAVFAFWEGARFVASRRYKAIGLFALAFFLLLMESNHNIIGLTKNEIQSEDWFVLGTAYLEQGDKDAALRYYRSAVRINPDHASALLNLGALYSREGNDRDAARMFQRAVKAAPGNPDAYYNYATSLEALGRFQEAAALLEKALKVFTINDNLYMRLGAVYYQLGKTEEARRALEQALRINPHNSVAQKLYRELFSGKSGSEP
jgi:tetratricopeptide (TPR) repeat protein